MKNTPHHHHHHGTGWLHCIGSRTRSGGTWHGIISKVGVKTSAESLGEVLSSPEQREAKQQKEDAGAV